MFKETIAKLVHHKAFQATVISLILFNAILVGVETYQEIYEPNKAFFFTMQIAFCFGYLQLKLFYA